MWFAEEPDDDAAATPDSVRCMATFIMGPLRSPPLPLVPPAPPAPLAICRIPSGLFAPDPTASILSEVLATAVVAAELADLMPRPTVAPNPFRAPPSLPNPRDSFSDGVSGAPFREGPGGVSGGGAKEYASAPAHGSPLAASSEAGDVPVFVSWPLAAVPPNGLGGGASWPPPPPSRSGAGWSDMTQTVGSVSELDGW